ncbi:MAG TPA: hypothetical protein VH721_05520 [Gaiellaceae bacterium]
MCDALGHAAQRSQPVNTAAAHDQQVCTGRRRNQRIDGASVDHFYERISDPDLLRVAFLSGRDGDRSQGAA